MSAFAAAAQPLLEVFTQQGEALMTTTAPSVVGVLSYLQLALPAVDVICGLV